MTRSRVNMKTKEIKEICLKDELDLEMEQTNQEWQNKKQLVWLIFDSEAYSLKSSNGSLDTIPVQIAWEISRWSNENEQGWQFQNTEKKMYYVAESLLLTKYKNLLTYQSSYFTPNTLKKHEVNLLSSNFKIKSAHDVLCEFKADVSKCDIASAFNMTWDLKVIQNLCKMATTQNERVNLYPFPIHTDKQDTQGLRMVDIMIMGYMRCGKQLKVKGGGSGGLYTAANMYKVLCQSNEKQTHLAEKDVEMEKNILHKVLDTFDSIEDLKDFISQHNLEVPKWERGFKKLKTNTTS